MRPVLPDFPKELPEFIQIRICGSAYHTINTIHEIYHTLHARRVSFNH